MLSVLPFANSTWEKKETKASMGDALPVSNTPPHNVHDVPDKVGQRVAHRGRQRACKAAHDVHGEHTPRAVHHFQGQANNNLREERIALSTRSARAGAKGLLLGRNSPPG